MARARCGPYAAESLPCGNLRGLLHVRVPQTADKGASENGLLAKPAHKYGNAVVPRLTSGDLLQDDQSTQLTIPAERWQVPVADTDNKLTSYRAAVLASFHRGEIWPPLQQHPPAKSPAAVS